MFQIAGLGVALLVAAPVRVTLDLGVPVPLSVYGYRSKDGSRGLVWLGHAGLEARVRLLADVPLDVGVWLQASNIHGRDASASADIYFVSTGLMASYDFPLGALSLGFGLGFGVLWSGIVVDEGINVHTRSLGGLGRSRVDWWLSPAVALGVTADVAVFGPPLNRATWFNTPLRETVVLGFALSVTAAWGRSDAEDTQGVPVGGAL